MKIRAYPLLQQEGQASRAGDNKNIPLASRRSLPLPVKECNQNDDIPEAIRMRIRAHLAQVHTAQEELASLQKEENHLLEAEKLYQQIGQLLRQQDREEKTEKIGLLYRHLGKVRDMMEKLKPDFTSEIRPFVVVAPENEEGTGVVTLQEKDLEKVLAKESASLEAQRQKLAVRQMELIDAIAHNLVAVENISASGSTIRDDDFAKHVMKEVKLILTKSEYTFPHTQSARQNIAELLR